MSLLQDHYALLGVNHKATDAEIREAWLALSRNFHPDVNKSPGASQVFSVVSSANDVLSDLKKRGDYDRIYNNRVRGRGSLLLETHMSRQFIRRSDNPQLLYVLLRVRSTAGSIPTQRSEEEEAEAATTQSPLNLALVLDRSKSMAGQRLQSLKIAVHRIIDALTPEDYLSIISFSDFAEVVVPAQRASDKRSMKTRVSTVQADGATSILSGLQYGMHQIERYLDDRFVNHMVLITDGRTYGDEKESLALALRARERGISISGMGIGEDWNDDFLDKLATRTGGSSTYVVSPETVTEFLEHRVRSLASAAAERAILYAVPAPMADLQSVIRIAPMGMNLPTDEQPIPIGAIDALAGTTIMLQFHLNTGTDVPLGRQVIGRLDVRADVLTGESQQEIVSHNIVVNIKDEPVEEEPPGVLLEALSKVMLYKLQTRARTAIEDGNLPEATQKLEYLATRLFENGESELGEAAMNEARVVQQTAMLSDKGGKTMKYGTRALMAQETSILGTQLLDIDPDLLDEDDDD
ncbi:MAG: VWA domain-containing protein [Chloroflexi bacterium]|nr:VWA domain-containing protein [Chloroflexota bacterium]